MIRKSMKDEVSVYSEKGRAIKSARVNHSSHHCLQPWKRPSASCRASSVTRCGLA